MAERLAQWADVAFRIFPPVGIVLDLCVLIAVLFTLAHTPSAPSH